MDYSPYADNHARRIVTGGINDQAIRRKYEEGISIDGIESLDLDDAIWAERTAFGYAVFVHISDVTEAIGMYTPLDIEALKRTTSIYREHGVINMFPPVLSQNLLSLNEDGEKLTLSMRIELDHNGQIRDFDAYESIFRNRRRYDYESFVSDFLNPESEFHSSIQLMYEIANKRKIIRKQDGADANYNESDRKLTLGTKNERAQSGNKAIPTSIIEEFMILANIASATLAAKKGYHSVFRLHKGGEERAYYHNEPGLHTGLALEHYTHFTSPIRRYADMIVHRVIKLLYLRDEKAPYTKEEVDDLARHINVSRAVIEILGRNYDNELHGRRIVSRLKARNGAEQLNVSHFTQSLREMVSKGKRIPEAVTGEIIHDLENGDKSNWAWAIGVLLVSGNDKIKACLKKVLLDDRKFQAKAVLALLNVTKITSADSENLFEIVENESGNKFSITAIFKGGVFRNTINYGKIDAKDAVGMLRNKMLKRIVRHFCGK